MRPRNFRPVHRTVTGRVVYDRPVHKFTLKDALRIVRKVSVDDLDVLQITSAQVEIFSLLLKLLNAEFSKVGLTFPRAWTLATQILSLLSLFIDRIRSFIKGDYNAIINLITGRFKPRI